MMALLKNLNGSEGADVNDVEHLDAVAMISSNLQVFLELPSDHEVY